MTDLFTLAIEAKRAKNFELAHQYYKEKMKQDGISISLLRAVSKIWYLQGANYEAVRFNLAAAHMELQDYIRTYEQGNDGIIQAMRQIPREVTEQFPHPLGALFLLDRNILKHLAHAGIDHEITYEKLPEFKNYAEIYYAQILGDGSFSEKLQKFGFSAEAYMQIEKEHYERYGVEFLIDNLAWDQLDNPNVLPIYLK